MLSQGVFSGVKGHVRAAVCRRNLGVLAPMLQKATDPIQQLFVDKIREYKQKSGGGSKMLEPSPEIEKELKNELVRVAKIYGGDGGVDMTKFPTFKFADVEIDPINLADQKTK